MIRIVSKFKSSVQWTREQLLNSVKGYKSIHLFGIRIYYKEVDEEISPEEESNGEDVSTIGFKKKQ